MTATTEPTVTERISLLRQQLAEHDIDAWIALSSDPHVSEYIPDHFAQREWLSGFTGSAGTLVVTADEAAVWADSRYWVQAEQQLAGTPIHLEKFQPAQGRDFIRWLANNLPEGSTVAVDGAIASVANIERLEAALTPAGISLETELDLVSPIWSKRAPLPTAPIYAHATEFAGLPRSERIANLREHLAQRDADWQVLSSLDDIAWLFVLRGSDVEYNPVFLAHALIGPDTATLFVERSKIDTALARELEEQGITLADYADVFDAVAALPADARISFDPAKLSLKLYNALPEQAELVAGTSPTTLAKGIKSDEDLGHVRNAMEKDGAALCEFLSWLDRAVENGEAISELTVDERLTARRAAQQDFVSLSFPTIAGFNQNGALPHYRATAENHSAISGNGLLLIDSGAQYLDGTTDITRVIAINTPSDAQKRDYTRVLKATIALSRASFPEGTAAPSLDAIARVQLWRYGIDFGHGTGHGVGYFMNVHEGPQVISSGARPTSDMAMRKGMITSIEPGVYREGQWGVRIENLVANRDLEDADGAFGDFLTFETMTLCPIDTRPIDPSLLTAEEIEWLNHYHQEVFTRLSPRLEGEPLAWLERVTQPLA